MTTAPTSPAVAIVAPAGLHPSDPVRYTTRVAMSLAVRVMLALLLPTALCIAAYGYVNIGLRRQEMLSEAGKEVRDTGTAIEVALDASLRDHNIADMAELAQDLSRADRVLGVLIFDAQDHPVQASRAVQAYRERYEPLAAQAMTARAAHTQVRELDGMQVYAYAVPIGDDGAQPRGAAVVLRDLSYIDSNLRESARRITAVGLAVALIIVVGTWLALRSAVLGPVAGLLRGVESVGADALDVRVPVARSDELGRLAGAFNRMLDRLRTALGELAAKNDANVALERRLHHAQRLALIGQLSANVAHQVGSPLNIILGRAQYALEHERDPERDGKHFQEIVAGAERISRVIEQLLSQARRVRGQVERVDVGELAREALRFLEAECEHVGVRAELSAEPGVMVVGARDEIEQVILNLCVNALQAQPRGGALRVSVRHARGPSQRALGELVVEDAGPGVPAALRERVFEPFFTTKQASGGTGLGLAICDEIVRQHQGTISLGEGEGGGARFRVLLPAAGPQRTTSAPAMAATTVATATTTTNGSAA